MSLTRCSHVVMPQRLRHNVTPRNRIASPDSVGGTLYDYGMGIGRKIKERREELEAQDPVKYSVEATAKAAGMKNASTLYGLEREDQKSTTRLHALCSYLGLNVDWVDRGVGPRLVADKPSRVGSMVQADQDSPTGATDVAKVMRDAMEFGLLVTDLPESKRQLLLSLARAMKEEREAGEKPDRQTHPEQAAHPAK